MSRFDLKVRCQRTEVRSQKSPVKFVSLVFFEKFNPDETNKKVSLGTRGPEDGIFSPLRQAGAGVVAMKYS